MNAWSVKKNAAALSMAITAEFAAPVVNVWQLWADPRLLERWWGPPTHPSTFEAFDLTPGGTITYFMTGPEGDRHDGSWKVVEVDAPTRLVLEDAETDDDGVPTDGNGLTRMEVAIVAAGDVTRMILTSFFVSVEGMEEALAMGIEDGMEIALKRVDAILAETVVA
jgi:uncharacterized protein YndB with AHSA1/START domain